MHAGKVSRYPGIQTSVENMYLKFSVAYWVEKVFCEHLFGYGQAVPRESLDQKTEKILLISGPVVMIKPHTWLRFLFFPRNVSWICFFKNFNSLFLCVFVCVSAHMQAYHSPLSRAADNPQELVLSFHHLDLTDSIWDLRLGNNYLSHTPIVNPCQRNDSSS